MTIEHVCNLASITIVNLKWTVSCRLLHVLVSTNAETPEPFK